jgi:hypothetical protein
MNPLDIFIGMKFPGADSHTMFSANPNKEHGSAYTAENVQGKPLKAWRIFGFAFVIAFIMLLLIDPNNVFRKAWSSSHLRYAPAGGSYHESYDTKH